jgi:hypothetical protein
MLAYVRLGYDWFGQVRILKFSLAQVGLGYLKK